MSPEAEAMAFERCSSCARVRVLVQFGSERFCRQCSTSGLDDYGPWDD